MVVVVVEKILRILLIQLYRVSLPSFTAAITGYFV